jgi:hypothetical protein
MYDPERVIKIALRAMATLVLEAHTSGRTNRPVAAAAPDQEFRAQIPIKLAVSKILVRKYPGIQRARARRERTETPGSA